jgi:hypothetical protein
VLDQEVIDRFAQEVRHRGVTLPAEVLQRLEHRGLQVDRRDRPSPFHVWHCIGFLIRVSRGPTRIHQKT